MLSCVTVLQQGACPAWIAACHRSSWRHITACQLQSIDYFQLVEVGDCPVRHHCATSAIMLYCEKPCVSHRQRIVTLRPFLHTCAAGACRKPADRRPSMGDLRQPQQLEHQAASSSQPTSLQAPQQQQQHHHAPGEPGSSTPPLPPQGPNGGGWLRTRRVSSSVHIGMAAA